MTFALVATLTTHTSIYVVLNIEIKYSASTVKPSLKKNSHCNNFPFIYSLQTVFFLPGTNWLFILFSLWIQLWWYLTVLANTKPPCVSSSTFIQLSENKILHKLKVQPNAGAELVVCTYCPISNWANEIANLQSLCHHWGVTRPLKFRLKRKPRCCFRTETMMFCCTDYNLLTSLC